MISGFNTWVIPVSDAMKKAFGATNEMVNLYMVPASIIAFFYYFANVFIVKKIGVKFAILYGLVLVAIGCSINLLMEYNFYFTLLGETIQIIGVNTFMTLNGEICDRWFSVSQRPVAIAITFLSRYVSFAVNMIFPVIFISNDDPDVTKEKLIAQTRYFNFFRIGVAVFFFLICLIFFKEAPTKKTLKKNEEQ